MADKDMKWKTLSQKYLIEKPWLTARVDKVELPTGAIIDEYYVLEYPDWVNTIAITKDGTKRAWVPACSSICLSTRSRA